MSDLLISESFIDQTRGIRFGDSDPYEPYTDDLKRLFRDMQREYGRCMSKIYIDVSGQARPCGWVFEKQEYYEDTKEPFIREVWVRTHTRDIFGNIQPFFTDGKPQPWDGC